MKNNNEVPGAVEANIELLKQAAAQSSDRVHDIQGSVGYIRGTLDSIEKTIESISTTLGHQANTLDKQSGLLEEHIKRTNQLEDYYKEMEAKTTENSKNIETLMLPSKSLTWLFQGTHAKVTTGIIASITTIYMLLNYFGIVK